MADNLDLGITHIGAIGLREVTTSNLPTAASTNKGVIAYDSTANKPKYSNGSSWKAFDQDVDAASFAGTAYKASSLYTITHDTTPDGNNIYLKLDAHGAYLACNMATDTASKSIAFANGDILRIIHDASASTNGSQVYFDSDGATVEDRLLCVSPTSADCYIKCVSGSLLKIKHDASAATNGNAVTYDDGADERLESNCTTAANATISTTTATWVATTPAGTITLS